LKILSRTMRRIGTLEGQKQEACHEKESVRNGGGAGDRT